MRSSSKAPVVRKFTQGATLWGSSALSLVLTFSSTASAQDAPASPPSKPPQAAPPAPAEPPAAPAPAPKQPEADSPPPTTPAPAEKAAPETKPSPEAGSTPEPASSDASAAPTSEAASSTGSAASDGAGPANTEPAPGDAAPAQAVAAPETTPAKPTPPLAGEAATPKSASANQGVTPPEDDYEGAESQLSEEEKKPNDLMLNIMVDLTIPLAAASDFIGDVSVQGFSIDVRYFAFGNIGIGASVAFDSLSTKEAGSVEWNGSTITGIHRRDLSFTPILAKGYYAWREKEKFVPYVALGAGAARTARRINAGYFSLNDDSWHLTLSPEVGLHIPVGPTVIVANGRLGYLVGNSDQDAQMFGNVSLGLSIQ